MLTEPAYHKKVRDYFKAQPKTWEFFAKAKNKEEQLQQFKTELLKNTYKFDPVTDEAIYSKIAIAKEKLGLQQLNVTVYQAQFTDELNASIVYISGEAHIVLSGPVIKLLTEEELLAVLAHELTHVKLYSMLEGELEVADRIITAIANNYNSEPSWYETARLFRLYTEIFCDRGACLVTGNIEPVITSLVKLSTGLEKVNAESYLKQADEIFSTDKDLQTSGISHPENFMRAKAVQLWHLACLDLPFDSPSDQGDNAEMVIQKMIEGITDIDKLDIFKQKEMAALTKKVLQLFLKPRWFQTSLTLGLARQYFTDFHTDEHILLDAAMVELMQQAHKSVKEYLSYVLLDLVLADASLEEIPAGWAIQFAEDLQINKQYEQAIKKELKLSEKTLKQYKEKVLAAYHEVKESKEEQIYE